MPGRDGEETRQRLMEAAIATVAAEGIAATSARAIARTADVNQALIFYHFDSVEGLLAAASEEMSAQRAEEHAEHLRGVSSLRGLVDAARAIHAEEIRSGNLSALAQLLAGSRSYPALAGAIRRNFEVLTREVEVAIRRLISGSVLAEAISPRELAHSVAASFLGVGLMADLDGDVEPLSFDAFEALAELGDLILQGGLLQTAVLRRRLKDA